MATGLVICRCHLKMGQGIKPFIFCKWLVCLCTEAELTTQLHLTLVWSRRELHLFFSGIVCCWGWGKRISFPMDVFTVGVILCFLCGRQIQEQSFLFDREISIMERQLYQGNTARVVFLMWMCLYGGASTIVHGASCIFCFMTQHKVMTLSS